MSIATNLKRLRQAAKLTQPELAKKAGVTQQLISQIETGQNVTTRALPQLAAALGTTVDKIDPNYVAGAASRNSALAELSEIYDRLEAYPDWQRYLLEQARQLRSNVLGPEAPTAPAPATDSE